MKIKKNVKFPLNNMTNYKFKKMQNSHWISWNIATTGNTTPTGTKENDIFSPLEMKKIIWKQILIDLLNRFYVIKKICHWIAYQKDTNKLKKSPNLTNFVWFIWKFCEYCVLIVNHCNRNWVKILGFVSNWSGIYEVTWKSLKNWYRRFYH